MRLATSLGLSDGIPVSGGVTPFVNTKSLDFDGVNDFVNTNYLPPIALYSSGFSLSAWIKPSSTTDETIIGQLSSGNRFYWRLYGSFYWIGFGSWNDWTTISSSVITGSWQYVVLTYNPSDTTIRIYLDGVLEGSMVKDLSSFGVPDASLNIGASNSTGYLNGNIDEVSIWSTGLSSGDVSTLWNNGTPNNLNTALATTPIAWWRMGDSGTFFNSNWEIPEQTKIDNWSSHSMDFDGINDYVDCGDVDALDNVSTFTISVWFKLDGTGNNDTIFAKTTDANNRIDIIKHSNGILYFQLHNGGNGYLGVNFSDLGWNHVAMVFDGSQGGTIPASPYYQAGLQCYLNGSKITTFNTGSGTIPATTPTLSNNFLIGEYDVSAGYFLEGKVDELSIWSTALSSSDISTLYNSGTPSDLTTALGSTPVNWWRMGESSNWNGTNWQLPDYSKNALFSQKSLNFDGVDDYISFGQDKTDLKPTGAFSLSLWANWDSVSGLRGLWQCGQNRGYMIWSNGTTLQFYIYTSSGWVANTSSVTLATGQWYHLCATWDGSSTTNFYVNAGTPTTSSVSDIDYIGTTDHDIGRYIGNEFSGKLDNVAIFDTALEGTDITAIYNSGVPTDLSAESNLVAYWTFDDATFSTNWNVPDNSTNSNDGTSSGMVEVDLEFNTPTNPNAGLSSGMAIDDKVNNAPDNINQGLSSGMGETAPSGRSTDVP